MTKHLTQKWKELVEDTLEHTIEPEIRPDYHGNNMYRLKINFRGAYLDFHGSPDR